MRKFLTALISLFLLAGPAAAQMAQYQATLPTLSSGANSPLQVNSLGELRTAPSAGGAAAASQTANADGQSNTAVSFTETSRTMLFNGATWDRARGNFDTGAQIAHVAASAGTNSGDQVNYNGRGIKAVVDITALTGTGPTLTVVIQGKDIASGKYYTLLTSTALAAVATTVLEVYPGITAAANLSASTTLPRTFRILTTIGGTTPAVTATVGASVIL